MIFHLFNATCQCKAGVGCVCYKQCHVILFALVWHVKLGSSIFLTAHHYHEIQVCWKAHFCCFRGILTIKYKLGLLWRRVLLVGLVRRWREIGKIILVVVLPSFLLIINSQLSVKSLLGSLTMLSKPSNSYIPLSIHLLLLILLGMCWRSRSLVSNKDESPNAERVTLSVMSKNENRTVGDSKMVL